MRVLILAQFYPPNIGGVERHVQSLGQALAGRGHQVAVATVWHPGLPEFALDGTVRVHRIRGSIQRLKVLFSSQQRLHPAPLPDPELAAGLRRVLRTEQPEVIHVHNWLVYPLLALRLPAPLVYSLHDYSLTCAQQRLMRDSVQCEGPALATCLRCAAGHYGPLKGPAVVAGMRLMAGPLVKKVSRFIPVSTAVAAGSGLIGSQLPYEVIPNFVPDNVAEPTGEVREWTDRLPPDGYLMFAGDLRRDKGIHVLLAAYAKLESPPPLVMIGRPSSDLPSSLPPGVLVFQSWPHNAVMRAFRRASIALAPSIWHDPCPTVAMEALCAGVPVIASRIGGLADIVEDGSSGLLVEPGDIARLAAAMQQLIADNARRQQLAEGAARRAAAYHASTVVPEIERVYREVTGDSPRMPALAALPSLPPFGLSEMPDTQRALQ